MLSNFARNKIDDLFAAVKNWIMDQTTAGSFPADHKPLRS